jgi:hypothetical protein
MFGLSGSPAKITIVQFQELIFYDKGYVGGGVLIFRSTLFAFAPRTGWLYSPHADFVAEFAHAAMNLAVAGGVGWCKVWRKALPPMALSQT